MTKEKRQAVLILLAKVDTGIKALDRVTSDFADIHCELLKLFKTPRKKP